MVDPLICMLWKDHGEKSCEVMIRGLKERFSVEVKEETSFLFDGE